MLTAAFMKFRERTGGDSNWYGSFSESLLTFTRFWGFSFLIIPAIWIIGSAWMERHHPHQHLRSISLTLGSLILAGVIILFYWLVSIAAAPPIISPVQA